jgi:DNA repair photolyase
MASKRRKTGTREWSKTNLSIAKGCSHDCAYCYARHDAVQRFKRVEADAWTTMVVDPARVSKGYGKRKNEDSSVYDIMFPTAHDIVPEILDDCVTVLKKVLAVGNTVLVVSKPHLECVERLLEELSPWKGQVTFRFTIGSDDDEILSLWEPGAPGFNERLSCLKLAFEDGWTTSVSAEPMLDPDNIDRLVEKLAPFVSETLWIGKMNKMRNRCVGIDDSTIEALENGVSDEKVLAMVDRLGSNPIIEWKDSIKLVIEARGEV